MKPGDPNENGANYRLRIHSKNDTAATCFIFLANISISRPPFLANSNSYF